MAHIEEHLMSWSISDAEQQLVVEWIHNKFYIANIIKQEMFGIKCEIMPLYLQYIRKIIEIVR